MQAKSAPGEHEMRREGGEKQEVSWRFPPLMCACVLKISPFALVFLVKFSVRILMSFFLFCLQSTLIFNLLDVSPNLWYSQCLPCSSGERLIEFSINRNYDRSVRFTILCFYVSTFSRVPSLSYYIVKSESRTL